MKKITLITLFTSVLSSGFANAKNSDIEHLNAASASLPFSQIVRPGGQPSPVKPLPAVAGSTEHHRISEKRERFGAPDSSTRARTCRHADHGATRCVPDRCL